MAERLSGDRLKSVPVQHSTFREEAALAVDWVASYLEGVRDLPVLSQVEPGAIRSALPATPPEQPEPFSAILEDLDRTLMPGLTHWQSPRFFAYFATTGSEPGVLAELLIAGLNQVGILWRTSPALQELEELTVDWLRQLVGLPEEFAGHIEDTASTGVLAAVIAARSLTPDRNVLVVSEHAHSVGEKAARLLGLELRKAPADDEFRLRPDPLGAEDACAVIATVGTTSTSSVDPVPEIAALSADAGAWLHVDAAYAGSAMVCEENRWAFAGVERADSLVVNPHKWLLTPIDCSLLYTSRPDVLREAFSIAPAYLRASEEGVTNLTDYGPALGRRFRSLKLWAVIRCYGREGLQAVIREHQRLARLFASWVEDAPGWEVVAPVPFSLVCFRKEASDEENEALLERVNASGEAYLSHTVLDGRVVLRFAVGHHRTTEEDVRRAWELLQEL